jgi:hypothetical protein
MFLSLSHVPLPLAGERRKKGRQEDKKKRKNVDSG